MQATKAVGRPSVIKQLKDNEVSIFFTNPKEVFIIRLKNSFLEGKKNVICKIQNDELIIRAITIDTTQSTAVGYHDGGFVIALPRKYNYLCKIGRYEIDTEYSNEDELIIPLKKYEDEA